MNWVVFGITVEVLFASLTMSSLNAIYIYCTGTVTALWHLKIIHILNKKNKLIAFFKHSINHLFMCKLSWWPCESGSLVWYFGRGDWGKRLGFLVHPWDWYPLWGRGGSLDGLLYTLNTLIHIIVDEHFIEEVAVCTEDAVRFFLDVLQCLWLKSKMET